LILKLKIRDQNSARVVRRRIKRSQISKIKASHKRKKIPWNGRRSTERIATPYAFNIGSLNNRRTFAKFLSKLRQCCLIYRQKVILDFSETAPLTAPGMLLFVAELDRIKRILGADFSVGIENVRNRLVNQVLKQIGIYALCELANMNASDANFDDEVRHWRYATGERANERTNRAFENVEGRLSPELAKGMWKGVSEAVVNSVQHAYKEPRGVDGPRLGHSRWWMFSQEKDGQLTVAVCDLGIGIPRSLPMNWNPSILARLFEGLSSKGPDARAILAALEVGTSSTQEAHRGKGLAQIWNTLRAEPSAKIAILSNRGQISWDGRTKKEAAIEHDDSIFGTMIIWTVDIESGKHEEGKDRN